MTEQEKRETVIKGLEGCFDALVQSEHAIAENGVVMSSWQDRAKRIDAIREAIALLKAQEPRVIQFDEIDNYEVLWLEIRDVGTEEGLAPWVKTRSGNWFSPLLCSELQPDMILSTPEEYGKFCRGWTSRPTDAQREATPWRS